MKIPSFPKIIRRAYLRRASVYRRAAGRKSSFDFSADALIECFRHESYGDECKKDNGYLFGKLALDITISSWREDIEAGLFCKAEFYTPITKWYAEPALRSCCAVELFPWRAYIAQKALEAASK